MTIPRQFALNIQRVFFQRFSHVRAPEQLPGEISGQERKNGSCQKFVSRPRVMAIHEACKVCNGMIKGSEERGEREDSQRKEEFLKTCMHLSLFLSLVTSQPLIRLSECR